MDSAFVAIVPTRPCPLFGRPVHHRDGSRRFRPGAAPQALRIPPRGGHPALLGTHRGQRGITPAFGYGAPHPSTSGTSTHLSTSLPSAHYGPLRRLWHPTLCRAVDGGPASTTGLPCCQSPRAYVLRPLPRRAGRPSSVGASSRPQRPSSMERGLGARMRPFEAARASLALRPVRLLTRQRGPLSPGLRRGGRPSRRPRCYPGVPTRPGAGLAPAAWTDLSRRTLHNVSTTRADFRGLVRTVVNSVATSNPSEITRLAPEALRHQSLGDIACLEFDSSPCSVGRELFQGEPCADQAGSHVSDSRPDQLLDGRRLVLGCQMCVTECHHDVAVPK